MLARSAKLVKNQIMRSLKIESRYLASMLFGLLCLPGTSAQASPTLFLRNTLSKLAIDKRLGGADIGVFVATKSGKQVAAVNADKKLLVASSAKLVTSAAALSYLGPEYRFKTELYVEKRQGAVVKGELFLKGYGDPVLGEGELRWMVDSLYEAGVRQINGGLTIDESYFDRQVDAPLFDTRKSDAYYRVPNGALSIQQNVVFVRVVAGFKAGDPARVYLRPSVPYLRLDDKVSTVASGRAYVGLKTYAKRGRTKVVVRGKVRLGYRSRLWRKRINHPGRFCAALFRKLLRQRGIRLQRKRLRRARVPKRLRPIVVHKSRTLGAIVRTMNKYSSNFIAEQLVKVLGAEHSGRPGSWADGLKVIARHLRTLGISSSSYVMKNGSGLYEAGYFTTRQLVRVVQAALSDFRYGPELLASLAVAGADGTLRRRFIGLGAERYVRAKTGTLAKVVSLSGVAGGSKKGKAAKGPLVFSIVISELPKGYIGKARQVADEMAAAIVAYLES
jgi:D-alanyl-D-alanine carboxypeptidase/D-alanyl-D-alanine-endopeptidase (penicillin-binding protein 4)